MGLHCKRNVSSVSGIHPPITYSCLSGAIDEGNEYGSTRSKMVKKCSRTYIFFVEKISKPISPNTHNKMNSKIIVMRDYRFLFRAASKCLNGTGLGHGYPACLWISVTVRSKTAGQKGKVHLRQSRLPSLNSIGRHPLGSHVTADCIWNPIPTPELKYILF